MKALISSMIILGLISATPVLAEKPAGAGAGQSTGVQTQAYGESMKKEGKGEMHQKKAQGGQGEMNQERHRELEKKQVGKETGKGSAQGESKGDEKGKKWWKFWGE